MRTATAPAICILAVVLISSTRLEAQVIPGRWEKLDGTVVGTEIIVRLETSINIQGRFQGSTPDGITVVTDGSAIQVAKADVREVTTAQIHRDGLRNGALIGGGIGLGVALSLLAVAASGEGHVLQSAKWAGPLAGFGVGLGAGTAIDAGRKQRDVLYRVR
jgi:hypothetical protein